MDWSKAKSILIIALLITNVILGSFYLNQNRAVRAAEEKAAENAVIYARSKGISFEAELPSYVDKLPVVFVRFEANEQPGRHQYRGLSLEASDLPGTEVIPEKEGENSGKLIPVSQAILKLIENFTVADGSSSESGGFSGGNPENLVVSGMELVYVVYGAAELGAALEDTAIPAWKFTTSAGTYYIDAFAQ